MTDDAATVGCGGAWNGLRSNSANHARLVETHFWSDRSQDRRAKLRTFFLYASLGLLTGCARAPLAPTPVPVSTPTPVPAEALIPLSPESSPAPQAFLEQLTPMARRPRLHRALTVSLGQGFDEPFIRHQLAVANQLTSGVVPFVLVQGQADMELVTDGSLAEVQSPDGGVYAAVAMLRVAGEIITGGRIVFSDRRWAESPGVVLHELGHFLGFHHVDDPRRFVMAARAWPSTSEYHDWERQGWRRLASLPVGSSASSVRLVRVCAVPGLAVHHNLSVR